MSSSSETVLAAAALKPHHVHLYALVRVKVANVAAPDPSAAAAKATAQVDLHDIFDLETSGREDGVCTIDYAEEIRFYLVDPVAPDELEQSVTLDANLQPIDDGFPSYSASENQVIRTGPDGSQGEVMCKFPKTRAGAAHAQKVAAMLNAAAREGCGLAS